MRKGMIAIVQPGSAGFCVLVKLIELFENDILFQWEVRNGTAAQLMPSRLVKQLLFQ